MNQDTCQKDGNNSKKGNNMNFTFYTKRCAFRKKKILIKDAKDMLKA